MNRIVLLLFCTSLLVTPTFGTSDFNKTWKEEYLGDDADPEFVSIARKAGCNVCHVKGKKKQDDDSRNEYGRAINEFLKAEDFPKDWVKANPDEAKKKILAGIKKANEKESQDGKKFGEKIEQGELPATDAGI